MKCPFCDELEDKVVDSRMAKEGEVIRRRRECLGCKRRYTTYERVEEILPVVVKKDGRRESFDRTKILNQFAHEYWYEEMNRHGFPVTVTEHSLPDATLVTAPGIDPSLPGQFTTDEWREAARACKNSNLRTEVFTLDAPATGATPQHIKKNNYRLIQPAHTTVLLNYYNRVGKISMRYFW